jgi:tetratricopeptide (TPR) repeat protein
MYIKRDYRESFFDRQQKPRRNPTRLLFILGLLIGGLAVFVTANMENLQAQAMEIMGLGPTATPLPSDLATLADQLMIAGDLAEAQASFEQAIARRPDYIPYRYEYGRLMIAMDQPDIAREQGAAIVELDISDPRGYALNAMAEIWLGNSTVAIPLARAGLDLGNGYESHLYSALARAYTNVGQYNDGVEAGAMAIQADPGDANARRSYAYSLSWVRANDEAIDQLEAAILIDPTNIAAHMELALQYVAQNRDQEAINIYDQVLAIQPRNARALRRLCSTYRKIGQFERALGFCQDAADADPTSTGAWYELGLLQYNDYQMAAARDSFAACVDINPASLACKHRLGLTYYYLQECDLAWETLQDSLLMAQAAQGQGENVTGFIENIQAGLTGVVSDCPGFGRPTATPITPTPSPTPEATVQPSEGQ